MEAWVTVLSGAGVINWEETWNRQLTEAALLMENMVTSLEGANTRTSLAVSSQSSCQRRRSDCDGAIVCFAHVTGLNVIPDAIGSIDHIP